MKLINGYDRKSTSNYRYMTVEEAKNLKSGETVKFRSVQGCTRNAKVNGKPQTWKRDLNRVRVPVKYGLYEYDRMETQRDGTVGNGQAVLVVLDE